MDLSEGDNYSKSENRGFLKKISVFSQTRRTILLLIILLVFLVPSLFLYLNKSSKIVTTPEQKTNQDKNAETPKTWEIIVSYDQKTQKLSLKKLTLINKRILPDPRAAQFSSYELSLLSNDNTVLYKEKINISEQVLYDLLNTEGTEGAKASDSLESAVYVPFQPSAAKIIISKNNQPVLEISLPKNVSFRTNVLGDTSLSCGPMTVVFLSDNYKYEELNKYESDVASIVSSLNSVEPYNSVANIFDFQVIKNETSFGCETGLKYCFNQKQAQIKQVALNQFPRAAKFVVLVNNPNAEAIDGDVLGGTSGPGGDVVIFTTNRKDAPSELFKKVAIHEFLGHAVGILLDRYIYPANHPYSTINNINIEPNCANPGSIPALWKNIGVNQTFPGCTSAYLYAPSQRDCPGSNGNSQTVMSTTSCSQGSNFDSIEKNWIQTQILPLFPACPTLSPTPSPTPTPTPTKGPYSGDNENVKDNCRVKNLTDETKTCSFNSVDSTTLWCRKGSWICEPESEKHIIKNWCTPEEEQGCSIGPGVGPQKCVECEADEILQNDAEYFCMKYKGDCSNNNTSCGSCSEDDRIDWWVTNNKTTGCKSCSTGSEIPGTAPEDTSQPSVPMQTEYNCVEDPKCKGGDGKSIQVCQLVCTPK